MSSAGQGAGAATLRVAPKQARGKEKIARVLAAADQLAAAEGADAITTIRVAAEARISVGSLYRYLPNREAIIESLARHYLGLLEAQMDALVSAQPAGDQVGAAIDAFADFYRTHPGFRALWFSRHLTEETRALDRTHKSVMAHRIRDMFAAQGFGGTDDTDLLQVARAVQLSTDALIQEAFRINPDGDRALLDQAKIMTRSYLAALAKR